MTKHRKCLILRRKVYVFLTNLQENKKISNRKQLLESSLNINRERYSDTHFSNFLIRMKLKLERIVIYFASSTAIKKLLKDLFFNLKIVVLAELKVSNDFMLYFPHGEMCILFNYSFLKVTALSTREQRKVANVK